EAMTVVDVNTGKFTGSGGNLEETVTKNNLEAAEEMVRQLRLRDIGGIIVIDFIDMVLESNRDLVLRRLVECLGRDRTRHQVAEVTSLGLVQMTRKRIGSGLIETFSEDCDHCKGRGIIVHDQPIEPSNRSVGMGGGMGGGGGNRGGGGGNGGGNSGGNGGGGNGGGDDEPRGRRNRGGRGRNRGGDDNASTPAEKPAETKPSPMALAGSKPHPESEDVVPPEAPVEVAAPVDEAPAAVESAPVTEPEAAAEPKGADADVEAGAAAEQDAPTPEPVTAPVVVTTTRRRRAAGRPAGPAVAADEAPSASESKTESESEHVPVTDDPVEPAEATEAAPGEGDAEAASDEAPVFHVPVKKKGSRKR
ncbi:MAG: ribonuclease E/G, partial [Marmoricola sp.]